MIKNKFYVCFITLSFISFSGIKASSIKEDTQISLDRDTFCVTVFKAPILLKSISDEDLEELQSLNENSDVMQWVGKAETKTRDQVIKEFNAYKHCWKKSIENNTINYNMLFSVSIKEEAESMFAGVVNLFTPHTGWVINQEGRIEISGYGKPEDQNKKYGSQTFQMILEDYIPYLQKNNFTVNQKPISSVEATCKPDNILSYNFLNKFFGAPVLHEKTDYGSPRYFFKRLVEQGQS